MSGSGRFNGIRKSNRRDEKRGRTIEIYRGRLRMRRQKILESKRGRQSEKM